MSENTPNEMPTAYEPHEVEQHWYPLWEKNGDFAAKGGDSRPPYSIVVPPPNVTGSLHMGHALNATLQDLLSRYHRMRGLQRALASRLRPRGHRHPERGGKATQEGRQKPARFRA
jgi:isoleucyl-tRNA synthetase